MCSARLVVALFSCALVSFALACGGEDPEDPGCEGDGDCPPDAGVDATPGMDAGDADSGARDAGSDAGCADCDDGIDCTLDRCVEGACVQTPRDAECDDGSACSGTETCDPELGCQPGEAVDCDDSDPCTADVCDEETTECENLPLDADRDGQGPVDCGGLDCDDGNPDAHDGAMEACNGADDDCDGQTDEGVNACGGVCPLAHAPGVACDGDDSDLCEDDAWACAGANATACSSGDDDVEVCDGDDDDCDGTVDEGGNACGGACALDVAPGTACDGSDLDACTDDAYVCDGLNATRCPAGGDNQERCDGDDDDCDGTVDEGGNACGGVCALAHAPGAVCDGDDADLCADDTYGCSGLNATTCQTGADNEEVCDGDDDDCDGTVDEGANACGGACALADAPGTLCDGADSDQCSDDAYECDGLNETICARGGDDVELCDGEDDDCDGQTDEGTCGRWIAAGGYHSCALSGATLKCWGWNRYGQLGLGDVESRGDEANEMGADLPAVSLGAGRTATAIAAGELHTCALLDDSTIRCWGNGGAGRLGLGDTSARGDAANEMGDNLPAVSLGAGRTATAVSAGFEHTCALLDDGTVKCWGDNAYGQLGLGNTSDRGDAANEMGDNLPAVSLGVGRTATAVSAGWYHTCALLDDATVKCWGYGLLGQLGAGDGHNLGDHAGEMGDALPPVDLGTGRTATAVVAGGGHTCALLDDRTVKCWGYNGSGQLGLGDADDRLVWQGDMGDNLPAVSLGAGRVAIAILAGYYHTCAQLDDGAVKCWGSGGNGRLGQGDVGNRGDEANEMGDDLSPLSLGTGRVATEISAGEEHNCVLLDDGAFKCWGANGGGQLGLGDDGDRGDFVGEMGDALPAVDL